MFGPLWWLSNGLCFIWFLLTQIHPINQIRVPGPPSWPWPSSVQSLQSLSLVPRKSRFSFWNLKSSMIWPQPISPALTLLCPFILPLNIQISKLNCFCLFTILSCLCGARHVTLLWIDWASLWTLSQHHYRTMHILHNVHYFCSPSYFFPFFSPTKASWWTNEVPDSILCPYSLWERGKLLDLSECWFFIRLFFSVLWRFN